MSSSRSRSHVEDRRGFLRASSLGLAAVAFGCRGAPPNAGAPPAKDTALADPGLGASKAVANPSGTVAVEGVTPECHDTDDNIEGPFFKPSSPERSNLVEPGMTGVRLTIRGRVLGTGCGVVLAGAVVDFWQADAGGAYYDVKLRGHQIVGPDGSYTLQTVIPGHYLNGNQYRPAHIHVKVKAPGHPLLTTQLYFDGDPYNDIDPFIKKSLIMPLANEPAGAKASRFDFVLRTA
jgi:protocatechuate 3,4-dioxygenase beta subunit